MRYYVTTIDIVSIKLRARLFCSEIQVHQLKVVKLLTIQSMQISICIQILLL